MKKIGNTVLAKKLRNLREEKGLSRIELCKKAGISQNYCLKLESEKYFNPSAGIFKKLAVALDVTADYLMSDNVEMQDDEIDQLICKKLKHLQIEDKKKICAVVDAWAK